jgi:hypothetical protein
MHDKTPSECCDNIPATEPMRSRKTEQKEEEFQMCAIYAMHDRDRRCQEEKLCCVVKQVCENSKSV